MPGMNRVLFFVSVIVILTLWSAPVRCLENQYYDTAPIGEGVAGVVSFTVSAGAAANSYAPNWSSAVTQPAALSWWGADYFYDGQYDFEWVTGMNNSGVAVGYVANSGGAPAAAIWGSNGWELIPDVGNVWSQACAINDSGLVVGTCIAGNSPPMLVYALFTYSQAEGTTIYDELSIGYPSILGMNNNGVVLLTDLLTPFPSPPYIWSAESEPRQLGGLPEGFDYLLPLAINGQDQVLCTLGKFGFPSSPPAPPAEIGRAAVWSVGIYDEDVVTQLPLAEGIVNSWGVDINDNGQVIGTIQDEEYVITPVVWNSVTSSAKVIRAPGCFGVHPLKINNVGEIAATGVSVTYSQQAQIYSFHQFLHILTPTASPNADETPPEAGSFTIWFGEGQSQHPLFSLPVTDSATGVNWESLRAWVDGFETGCSESSGDAYFNFSHDLPWGYHNVMISVLDNAGNELVAQGTFQIGGTDTTPPEVEPVLPTGTIGTASPDVIATISDGESWVRWTGIQVYIDSHWVPAIPSLYYGPTGDIKADFSSVWSSYGPLSNGEHTVAFTAYDNAFNYTEAEWSFTVDADLIVTDESPTTISTATTPTISANVSRNGGVDWENLLVYLDSHPVEYTPNLYTGDISFQPPAALADGVHTVIVGGSVWKFAVDTTPPEVMPYFDIFVEATDSEGISVVFSDVEVQDSVSHTISVTFDYQSGSVFPIGDTTVTITAVDEAGNESTEEFEIHVLDNVSVELPYLFSSFEEETYYASGVSRSCSGTINTDFFSEFQFMGTDKPARFIVNLFEGATYTATVVHAECPYEGSVMLTATFDDVFAGQITLGYSDGILAASIFDPELGNFEISYAGNDLHTAIQINGYTEEASNRRRQQGEPIPAAYPLLVDYPEGRAPTTPRVPVSVLFIYSPELAAVAGMGNANKSAAAIRATVLNAVEYINTAFYTSNHVGCRIEIADIQQYAYSEHFYSGSSTSIDMVEQVRDLANDTGLTTIRDNTDGDLCVLLTAFEDKTRHYGGIVHSSSSAVAVSETGDLTVTPKPEYAYAVACVYDNLFRAELVAHEIGHLFGCLHERTSVGYPNNSPYYGWGASGFHYGKIQGDIMYHTTHDAIGTVIYPRFSTPDPASSPFGTDDPIGFRKGDVDGNGNQAAADCATLITLTARMLTSYRPVYVNPPDDPDLDGMPNSVDQDDDNDNFGDSFETLLDTDPLDQESKPSGEIHELHNDIRITKGTIKVAFTNGQVNLAITGVLLNPTPLRPNEPIAVDVGGISRLISIDKNGGGKAGDTSVIFKRSRSSAQVAFQIKIKGNLASELVDEDLLSAQAGYRWVGVTIRHGAAFYWRKPTFNWKAKPGHSGSATFAPTEIQGAGI